MVNHEWWMVDGEWNRGKSASPRMILAHSQRGAAPTEKRQSAADSMQQG
jgi:hypothetical protein